SIAATVWMAMLWQRAIAAERLAADRLAAVETARSAEKLAHEATAAEAERAKRTVAFLNSTLRFVDPWKHPGRDITPMREMLDAALARLDTAFADQPIVQASLANTLGYDYWTLGLFDAAEPVLRRAYEQSLQHLGEEHEQTLAAQFDLGSLLTERGKHPEAEALFRQMLDVQCRILGPDDRRTLNTMNNLGYDIDWQGRVAEAAEYYRAAYEGLKRIVGPHSVDALHSANNLAIAMQTLGQPAEAERLLGEVIAGRWLELGPLHPESLQARMNLAKMIGDNGRVAESLVLLEQVVDDIDATLEAGHPLALSAKGNLADTLGYLGRGEDALRMNQEVYELQVAFAGPHSPSALLRLNQVMCSMIDLKQLEPAAEIGRTLRQDLIRVVGAGDMRTLIMAGNLAFVLNELKRSDEAVAIWLDVIRDGAAALGENAQPVILARTNLGGYHADRGEWAEAERNYRAALASIEQLQQLSHWRAAVMLGGLGRVLTETGRFDEAQTTLDRAYAILHETFGDDHERTQRVVTLLIALHEKTRNPAKADEFRAKQRPASLPVPV
ncbi:MAG: tetratricopeptide repeat protein, partial [Phycisphaerae bacterium]